jgi:acetylornithine deacetylase/succinyl-diaminopimelate desuccinylase-like protein
MRYMGTAMGGIMIRTTFTGAALFLIATTAQAQEALRPDQAAFRSLYKELVETNTTLSVGSCTLAAEQMAARLKAAGFKDSQLFPFVTADKPKEGGLVAVFPGTSERAKPILLLAHIDVVEAKREDWQRDPFTLIEENGYFFARGTRDDKAQAAIWTDTMIRFMREGYRPKRTVKLALTCGEETTGAFNGAEWLTQNKRDLIDAEFAINEGGGGRTDLAGTVKLLAMQVGEKVVQNFRLETTNPGGHSSVPRPDNAIYSLATAISKVGQHEFPVQFNDTTRSYFTRTAKLQPPETASAIVALLANPNDEAANRIVSADATHHSMLRTTCVATMLEAGHAMNALPQRARAIVNCRMFPGSKADNVQAALANAIADPSVTITPLPPIRKDAVPISLSAKVFGPAEALAAEMFPGVPVLPTMSTGATDGLYLSPVGIPTYGVPGIVSDPDGGGVHGLNERIRVKSLYIGRDYLYRLVKLYAMQD